MRYHFILTRTDVKTQVINSATMWQEWKPLFLCTAGQNGNCCRIFKKYQMAMHQGIKWSYDKFTTSIMKT